MLKEIKLDKEMKLVKDKEVYIQTNKRGIRLKHHYPQGKPLGGKLKTRKTLRTPTVQDWCQRRSV